MKNYCTILLLMIGICISAQMDRRLAVSVDYTYRGRNAYGVGLEYRVTKPHEAVFNVAARALVTPIEDKNKIVPELRMDYGTWYLLGVSATPYAVEPRLGLSFLNMLVIHTGYAMPIHSEKYFKGITFGVRVNFGLTKQSKYYDTLNVIR
ncbi:hypothetical protein [Bergeyella zoohelcum]|uniref:Outer membrane protein beta-barrel domain-containing protein n=1 Tax=Bergeyella zoohelcum ATCC 43767 TaxID=883096 RepID=K1MME8_9FLAO|nr:hypothetical protein [Bergeyella zoohelcum]EKB57264.1 hypothetical protein HMPREF9699_01115 [Bergeyella zoohelcum ATCC 43767]SUV48701.1 Uncharacterised protein [Bergeyella zoohelcum]